MNMPNMEPLFDFFDAAGTKANQKIIGTIRSQSSRIIKQRPEAAVAPSQRAFIQPPSKETINYLLFLAILVVIQGFALHGLPLKLNELQFSGSSSNANQVLVVWAHQGISSKNLVWALVATLFLLGPIYFSASDAVVWASERYKRGGNKTRLSKIHGLFVNLSILGLLFGQIEIFGLLFVTQNIHPNLLMRIIFFMATAQTVFLGMAGFYVFGGLQRSIGYRFLKKLFVSVVSVFLRLLQPL